jgi:hypothetical protein
MGLSPLTYRNQNIAFLAGKTIIGGVPSIVRRPADAVRTRTVVATFVARRLRTGLPGEKGA